MPSERKRVKIAFIGGGSQTWGPLLIRDIIFNKGLQRADLDIVLLDTHRPRVRAIRRLFQVQLDRWKVNRVRISATQDEKRALRGADFVLIAISTGGLDAMQHDLAVPERYGIYHTVGDSVGPAGWARALRNIPIFQSYAQQIKQLAPGAYVLNYTNPMGALTKVLSDELGPTRVVGLCHGVFESLEMLQDLFGLEDESALAVNFGGLNHFFWILGFTVNGKDGYQLLRRKLRGRTLIQLLDRMSTDAHGWSSRGRLASELFQHYGYLTYIADRHTCEFFACYITSAEMMARFKLGRTSVEDRSSRYARAAQTIQDWMEGRRKLDVTPSRETAADIMAAIAFDHGFTDVVNMVNFGQIANLPLGAVVETMGYVDAGGARPLTVGPVPEQIRALCAPHAEVQLRTVNAGLSGNLDEALMGLLADPVCACLPASDVKRMGIELLESNRDLLPQFFPCS
jgi:alpha-galactosidase